MSLVTIEPLVVQDALDYANLRSAVASESIHPLLPEHAEVVLQRYCEDQMIALGYWKDERLVGACMCGLYPTFTKIELIIVHPDHRRQGIGKTLIDAVSEIVDEQGFGLVTLYCSIMDATLIAWYRKLGFKITKLMAAGFCVMDRHHRLVAPPSFSDHDEPSPM